MSKSISTKSSHAYNCGGGLNTDVEECWWGYWRYACDCETNRMSADFNSCASVSAGVAVVTTYFGALPAAAGSGLASSYWWLLASRLDANNKGKGVHINMTRALLFDITPITPQ